MTDEVGDVVVADAGAGRGAGRNGVVRRGDDGGRQRRAGAGESNAVDSVTGEQAAGRDGELVAGEGERRAVCLGPVGGGDGYGRLVDRQGLVAGAGSGAVVVVAAVDHLPVVGSGVVEGEGGGVGDEPTGHRDGADGLLAD